MPFATALELETETTEPLFEPVLELLVPVLTAALVVLTGLAVFCADGLGEPLMPGVAVLTTVTGGAALWCASRSASTGVRIAATAPTTSSTNTAAQPAMTVADIRRAGPPPTAWPASSDSAAASMLTISGRGGGSTGRGAWIGVSTVS